ncbi:MAG: prolipoprotein diacylglyceryl transferase [Chloroflexota bacterium]
MYPPFDPIIFEFGPLALRWYGILLVSGMIAASWVASRYVFRKGEDGELVWDMLVWILIPALIGARLYYVFIQSPRGPQGFDRFMEDPITILQIWNGGIHIFGAFIFGSIALLIYGRIRNLPMSIYMDGIGLGLPLGQAIGRWANFINQELYGPPTTLPWGLRIDASHRIPPYHDLAQYPESVRFQPLFLYESLWNFLGFGIMFWISRRFENWLKPWDLLLMYLIWYPLGRFFLEFIRTDSWFFGETPFNMVHVLSAISIIGSALIIFLRHQGESSQKAG